jgi:chemotaxis protein histidine kinase CheA
MIRVLAILILAAASAPAQDALTAYRQTADKAAADWEALAKGLEPRIARLLPCDPNSRAAVQEVSHASDVRLSALAAYLKEAAAKAKDDTESAKQVLAAQAALAGGWNTERTEAEQQGAAIEVQVADLKESMRKRGALAGAEQVLAEIARMVRERASKSADLAARKDVINALLGDLVVAYQDRQTALEKEAAQLDVESARWSAYYTARLARAATECTIINNPGGTPAPRKKVP